MGAANIGREAMQKGKTLEEAYGEEAGKLARERMSLAKIGKPSNRLGSIQTEEAKKLASDWQKERWKDEQWLEENAPERNKKIAEALSHEVTEAQIEKQSATMKKKWEENEEFKRSIIKNLNKPFNESEKIIYNDLEEEFPGEWRFNGDASDPDVIMVGRKVPDFVYIGPDDKKIVIEYNGFYTHNIERDQDKAAYMYDKGYITLNLPKEMINHPEFVKEKVHKLYEAWDREQDLNNSVELMPYEEEAKENNIEEIPSETERERN